MRGYAASGVVTDGDRDDLLDGAGDLPDKSTSKFDADIGVMASFGAVRAGVTVRNVTEPDFDDAATAAVIDLKRQTRAGVSYVGVAGTHPRGRHRRRARGGSLGEVRDLAAGAEAKLVTRASRCAAAFASTPSATSPAATHLSTASAAASRHSVAARRRARSRSGPEAGDRGWGIAARLVY